MPIMPMTIGRAEWLGATTVALYIAHPVFERWMKIQNKFMGDSVNRLVVAIPIQSKSFCEF